MRLWVRVRVNPAPSRACPANGRKGGCVRGGGGHTPHGGEGKGREGKGEGEEGGGGGWGGGYTPDVDRITKYTPTSHRVNPGSAHSRACPAKGRKGVCVNSGGVNTRR